MLGRRRFMQGAMLAVAGTVLGKAVPPATAAPVPRVGRQAPGYFRMLLGDVEVTALYDGGVPISPRLLHGAPETEVNRLLDDAYADPQAGIPTSINAFLVNTGRNLILVDTGVGTYFGDKAGLLPQSLAEAGYRLEQVDTVLLTHLHSDHALGLVDGAGTPLFTGAEVRVHEAEVAYWLGPGAENRVTEGQRAVLPALRAAVEPYRAAGSLRPFKAGEETVPGVAAEPILGHTPGHYGFRVDSGGASLLCWGDVVHCMDVQLPRPGVTIDFDADQGKAFPAREKVLARAARERHWVAGAHLPFPGIGRVRARDGGYSWLPAPYASLPVG